MANVLAVGAPTTIAASRRPIEHGRTPPPVRRFHQPGGSSLYASACLGMLYCRDAGLCLSIGAGLHLLHVRWSSSYRGSSLLGRGSWIAGKVTSWHGKMVWQLLNAL
jgi:hypothetical protein